MTKPRNCGNCAKRCPLTAALRLADQTACNEWTDGIQSANLLGTFTIVRCEVNNDQVTIWGTREIESE